MEACRLKNNFAAMEPTHVFPKLPSRPPAGGRHYASISAKFKGPGPGKYGRQPCTGVKDHDFTKYTEPAYTMRLKSKARSIIPTPAPNEYYIEKIHPIEEPNAPAYTIGVRTRYWENSPTPGPNSYTLPGTLGPRLPVKPSAPCLSMASSASVWGYAKDLVKGPGPAMYTIPEPDVYLHRQPAHSISQRLNPSSKDDTPGPPDYSVELVTVHKPRAPRFSLGIRHSEYVHTTPSVCIVKD
ncbi:hypothetical protein JD844_014183 [Phrynosoma platyrhinos]|uniref:Outer dense fiber protein 3 n=1 Tax=Phrynosoma platyrhinos TaxID=52577 RepID=A0ABQ7SR38_PHRPL|nr:hypothetical protein JD844_014183 [Phrynosoma platyrhinos]